MQLTGTQTYNSEKKKCENCLTIIKNANNEYRNHHSSVVISTVGNAIHGNTAAEVISTRANHKNNNMG